MKASLWFAFAGTVLLTWPWIVVGLGSLLVFPPAAMDPALAADPELAYPMMIRELMPAGLRGLMVATFLAAFMSTMDTHLCWGASYMVNDVYRRFLRRDRSERHYVGASRIAVVLLAGVAAAVAWRMDSIQRGWIYIIELTAGVALVWLLRWYWWRVNAWAEIAAMAGSVLLANGRLLLAAVEPVLPASVIRAADGFYAPEMDLIRGVIILVACTALWLGVVLATRPRVGRSAGPLLPSRAPGRLVGPGGRTHRSRLLRPVGQPHVAGLPPRRAVRLCQPSRGGVRAHRPGRHRRAPSRGVARGRRDHRADRERDHHATRAGRGRVTDALKIVLVGAGSREFGPASIRDLLLSDALCDRGLDIVLVDIDPSELPRTQAYAESVAERLGRSVSLTATTDLAEALPGARAVVMAIEIRRYFYWAQDFHVPRTFGSSQIYGENGGPGGLFHALRNMGPSLAVARAMETHCPDAWLVNYTNPLTKLCEAQSRLSSVRMVGLCHGVFHGTAQMAHLLGLRPERLEARASGLNHFSWFESVRDRETGDDLYPELERCEREAHWLHDWDEIALSRILFRVFGRYPSPGTNHIGEYLGWAQEFLGSSLLPVLLRPRRGHAVGGGGDAHVDLQPRRPPHRCARVPGVAAAPREAGEGGRGGRRAGPLRRTRDPPPRGSAVRDRHAPRRGERTERRLRARPARRRRGRGPGSRRRQGRASRHHGASPGGDPRASEDTDDHQPAACRRFRPGFAPDSAPGAAAGPHDALIPRRGSDHQRNVPAAGRCSARHGVVASGTAGASQVVRGRPLLPIVSGPRGAFGGRAGESDPEGRIVGPRREVLLYTPHHAALAPGALRLTPRTGVLAIVPFKGFARLEVEEGSRGRG